jgi:uncharacterized membrane protein
MPLLRFLGSAGSKFNKVPVTAGREKTSFNPYILLPVFIFGIIYSLISLVNHYLFRTSALDLGMFNQALYHCAHFQENIFTLDVHEREANYFASHFSPVIYLYSPFYFVFGSYTLLIIQIVSILAGGLAIYRIASLYFSKEWIPMLFMIQFYGIWGIYSALAFDFHDNVIAAMLVPWFLYYFLKNKLLPVIILFSVILMARENMSLWMIFILAGFSLWMRRSGKEEFRRVIRLNLLLIVISLIYFFIVVDRIMPLLSESGNSGQLGRYSNYGDSIADITLNILKDPVELFRILFKSTLDGELYKGIKPETHLMVIFSGGIALILLPEFLIMLIPVYLQKFIPDDYALWGINGHYSIEFVPILSISVIMLIRRITREKWQLILAGFIILLTYIASFSVMEHRKSLWYNPVNTIFYKKEHYRSGLNDRMIRKEIKKLPADARLSVSGFLAPHLAAREKIYMFPVVKDSEFIVLITRNRIPYPLDEKEFSELLEKYRNSSDFKVILERDELVILKRN